MDYYSSPHKPSLKKSAEYIQRNIKTEDAVVIIPSYWIESFLYYYPNARNILLLDSPDNYDKESRDISSKYARVWLIEVSPFIESFPLSRYFQNYKIVLADPGQQVRLILYSEPDQR